MTRRTQCPLFEQRVRQIELDDAPRAAQRKPRRREFEAVRRQLLERLEMRRRQLRTARLSTVPCEVPGYRMSCVLQVAGGPG